MKKQIVLLLSGLILISLFAGCSQVIIYDDHIEGCNWENVIYEPYFDEERYNDCIRQSQLIQQEGCNVYCQEDCDGCERQEDCEDCENCLEDCRAYERSPYKGEGYCRLDATIASPKPITLGQSIPVPRCSSAGSAANVFSGFIQCIDVSNCPAEGDCNPEMSLGCTIPNNYTCQIVREEYNLRVYYSGSGTIYVNGVPFQAYSVDDWIDVYFRDYEDSQLNPIVGLPSSITITADDSFEPNGFGITLERECCYECRQKSMPAAILYPKIDIEAFQIVGGDTIIKDGKVISSFNINPGVQQTEIKIENRGFFTQGNAMVQFRGLPVGVTVDISPSSQLIKAHNIASYEATFTVGPNVPSGTYKVTMLALSPNGTFDIIQIDLVIP